MITVIADKSTAMSRRLLSISYLKNHNHYRPGIQFLASRDFPRIVKVSKSTSPSSGTKPKVTRRAAGPGLKDNVVDNDNGAGVHFNPCNIQMISDDLYKQIFTDVHRQRSFDKMIIEKCSRHLKSHGLWGQKRDVAKPVQFPLPKLEGVDIDHHFRNIALQQTFRYRALMDQLVSSAITPVPSHWEFKPGWTKYLEDGSYTAVSFPEENAYVFDVEVCMSNGQVPTLACAVSPTSWYSWCSKSLVEGIGRDPKSRMTVDELIPFETDENEKSPPGGVWKEKIIIGHNVSYDRARIKEQYFLEKSELRFMDTMSMHIAVSGITSFQRALKMTLKSRSSKTGTPANGIRYSEYDSFEWNELSSLNNLADVYKLYCDGPEIKKDKRNVFVKGSLQDVKDDFQNLMTYCSRDVRATLEVFRVLLPNFYERFPHPVTLCGMLEMGTTYLPINANWERYVQKSEMAFENLEKEVKSILMKKATEAVDLLEGERYRKDPWLWDLDWKVPRKRISKKSDASSTSNSTLEKQFPAWYRKLLYKPGEEDFEEGPAKLSSSMQIVPKLLRLTWFGFPLHYSKTGGWGFLVKKPLSNDLDDQSNEFPVYGEESEDNENKSGIVDDSAKFPYEEWESIWDQSKALLTDKLSKTKSKTHVDTLKNNFKNKPEETVQDLADFVKGLRILSGFGLGSKKSGKEVDNKAVGADIKPSSPHPSCDFIPLPHKNGSNYRVGNPLAKDFLSKIEEGILSCNNGQDIANRVVTISKMVSYWRNNRDRIFGQMTLWNHQKKENEFDCESSPIEDQGAILAQVSVSGTLTRRAVEPTWMTASNAYADRIGSELKCMIQAPPNFYFVGADVDSQELWIASVIGDAHFAGLHGSTALGWMTLQGNKSAGTDMHSKTASLIGIGRDESKILNYARIYGAGVTFAERLLMQFNRQLSSSEAKTKARTMYKMTKGERKYLLNEEGQNLASEIEQFCHRQSEPFSKAELQQIMDHHHYPFREYLGLVHKLVWDEGTESHMFNRLEEIAQEKCPQTPMLGCFISRSLVPSVVHDDYMTSRVNWVVQSSAVDYLHLMLTCMGWLIKKYDINCRFSLSVHDEVRYLVHSEDRYRAALALQITNLFTRSFCSYQLKMYDLPQSVAFFSCVDVDKVLRKEVSHDCVTPSNPDGLKKGYNVPEGEALDIWDILSLTNSSLANQCNLNK